MTETWPSLISESSFLVTIVTQRLNPLPLHAVRQGGASVNISDCWHAYVEVVKHAEDAVYLCLRLKHVVRGCPKVYFCVSKFVTCLAKAPLLHYSIHLHMHICRRISLEEKL